MYELIGIALGALLILGMTNVLVGRFVILKNKKCFENFVVVVGTTTLWLVGWWWRRAVVPIGKSACYLFVVLYY